MKGMNNMTQTKAIYFDMDGTIADLYSVDGWLDMLRAYDPTPYEMAKPLVRLSTLARLLNKLQREGYTIGIVSWLSKEPTPTYDEMVINAKLEWLETHLPSVEWNEIHIVAYGTPKQKVVENPYGILFDDEIQNRENWIGTAYNVHNIIDILKSL
jgi:5'(3')-deoxyribonucleotidase